ncbi:class D beta-lactamase [candidate division KSB1 bacterium]|nr:class D beta-lactamase [candidate division KSB1 bacterium]
MNKIILTLHIILFSFSICQKGKKQAEEPLQELAPIFAEYGVDGAFAMYNLRSDSTIVYNVTGCNTEYSPGNTFDILHSLIGLETDVVRHRDFIIPYTGKHQYLIDSWNQNHTLETAFQQDVIWFFQELSDELGPIKTQKYVELCNYGNRNITSSKSPYWLSGQLRITPLQQLEFLKHLVKEDLPFSQFSIQTVKRIMHYENAPTYNMWAKTGRSYQDGKGIGWFVGFFQQNVNIYIFVTVIVADNPDMHFGKERIEITKRVLWHLGLF